MVLNRNHFRPTFRLDLHAETKRRNTNSSRAVDRCCLNCAVDKLKVDINVELCRVATNHNEMANIFVFGNYAAVPANMPNREFRAPDVVSERSRTLRKVFKLFAKTGVNLSFGLKPDFRSGLSFGLKH